MRDSLFLAWQYLRHHRLTTCVLIASMSLILFLPAGLQVIVNHAEQHYGARAAETPLLVGPKGSPLELVVAGLYFDKPLPAVTTMEHFQGIESLEYGTAIPLHVRYRARNFPIVGTTSEYSRLRGLRTAKGSFWKMLGECVIGASVARRLGLQVGDKIPVTTSTTFELDNPPLRLRVAGVLAPTQTPDDEAIIVALETAW